MKKIVIIVLFFLVLTPFLCLSAEPEEKQYKELPFPDLLEEDYSDDLNMPDLLAEDPDSSGAEHGNAGPGSEAQLVGEDSGLAVYDPLEPMNRVFFEFNDKLYFWVMKPVKTVYSQILPWDIRYCIGNFFENISAPVRLVNNLLQGEIEDAGIVAGRFAINTILGIGGLGDPAYRDFGIEPRGADFGQTLGKWGLGEGLYLFWPGLGPSTLRDTAGMVGDIYLHPSQYLLTDYLDKTMYFTADKANVLSLSPDVYEELKRIALDPYVASREAYYEYRRSIIAK